ncbi:unnamed protein product [Trifolium pratense]|uniref:Uncharacterized protein n=1 Tax=Trifolium pratense TaxID=57577 RepID=A0ACB0KJM8_TRIPR|nr:unnamed protein product [Trifolium pratense]
MTIDDGTSSNIDFLFYDVFLSFRGDGGTRYGFTDHLYTALRQKGIFTFRDDEELKIGAEIRASLYKAIENSRMLVVVLCQNYASSTWCLDELAHIIHCSCNKGNQVLIIFYKVEPSDVWNVKNSYEAAMIEHENRFGRDSEKVKAWRNALSSVRHLPSQHCNNQMYEPEFVKKIVEETSAKLPPVPLPMKHIVGLDSRFEMAKTLFHFESRDTILMLEIYGAGGIGKTTFAVDIYNKIRHQFEASSFLASVREKSNKSTKGLEDLQKTLLSEMGEETETMMGSTFGGGLEIKRRLGHKRVLLVLDDVDTINQLEALVGGCDWFGPGSKIIITTRDTSLVDKHVMDGAIVEKYKMEELNGHHSLELFCWHAFNTSNPEENFEGVSSLAVSYAKGVPLALKVIASNVKGGSPMDWERELDKYKKIPNAEIQGVLEISYISLFELDQKTFLDIACFFKGERWEYVERILKACGFFPSIRPFVTKCLINIDENGCLDMHDLIQNMGKEVIRKESPLNLGDRSRLWSHEEVLEVLKDNTIPGSIKIEGIMLDPPAHEEVCNWSDNAFKKMENLRILIIRNTSFQSAPSCLPNSLRLLDWKGYPSKSFPADFYPERIVDFKLPHSSLMLKRPFQIFDDLTFMNLSQCQSITQIPDISRAINLRVLTLDRCHKVKRFAESVGFMPKLACLSASECTMLKSFVPRMHLPSLEVLSFNLCKRLKHFPDVMQNMDKPLKIWMIGTAVMRLPNSIGNLTGLEYIDMSFCRGLDDLSSTFFLLPKLATLRIDGCSELRKSFKRFKDIHSVANGSSNLVRLYLSDANLSDEDLHIILESFPKLEDLNVSHNKFASLPKSIKGSVHLKSLDVSYCRNLIEIPELPLSIQKVDARYCGSLTSKASSVLWSKVCKEKKRIQVVMPKTKIPNWFHCVGNEDIPLFWARRKFPVVALALVFAESEENIEIEKDTFISDFFPKLMSDVSYTVGLHIFIDGHEVSRKNYHYCSVGENHMLMCDLRTLFTEEEWKGLDACVGDDWKAVQVQCESQLTLSYWGVYVFKQKTFTDDIDISFKLPNLNSSGGDYVKLLVPASCLVPKSSPEMSGQIMRHTLENTNPREIFGEYFPLLEFVEETPCFTMSLFRSWMIAKVDNKGETSAIAFGGSLKQQHEESNWDVVRYVELMMKDKTLKQLGDMHGLKLDNNDIQIPTQILEEVLRARVEFMREKGRDRLDVDIPIILEACHFGEAKSRRYWGRLQIKNGDQNFKVVLNKICQLALKFSNAKRAGLRMNIVLLKCQIPSTEIASNSSSSYEEEYFEEESYDPALEELMSMIEEDAMRFNKSFGKLKASIVLTNTAEIVSDKNLLESLFLRGQENLAEGNPGWGYLEMGLFGLGILGSGVSGSGLETLGSGISGLGRMGSNFKKTHYGKLRVEDEPFRILWRKCFWGLCDVLSKWSFYFIVYVCPYFYRIPIIRKLLVWGWWLVEWPFCFFVCVCLDFYRIPTLRKLLLLGWWLVKQIFVPSIWSFNFFARACLYFYRIPTIRKLLVWGWWLVKQIFVPSIWSFNFFVRVIRKLVWGGWWLVKQICLSCKKLHRGIADSSLEDRQIAFGVAKRILRARVELMKENSMDTGMPIILEYIGTSGATNRHFWGTVEIKVGDPFYKPLFKRQNQISGGLGTSDSDQRVIIVKLKCQPASEEEASSSRLEESLEDGNYNPELEELMKMIEQDAMKFNKSYGKMKASIVQADESFFDNYLTKPLLILGKLTMFGSATKFKVTPYGKMRAADEPFRILRTCFWGLIFVMLVLCIWSFNLFARVCLYFYRIPIIRKLLVWGWWLAQQIFLSCKKLYGGNGKIIERIKVKEL